MHIFTSVTANYVPKARVLAKSVKKHHPKAQFHLLLSDKQPEWLHEKSEHFDSIINIDELSIPNKQAWIFKHRLVELCTAVKGFGFQEIIKRHNPDKIIYLDPDITVMSRLDSITERLDKFSILLTPHQTEPDTDLRAIVDNEICSLKHGIYNLGFVAIRNSDEGRRFADWWAKRLEHFCFDDIPNGLFTDQRWCDLAPSFFEDLLIMREPIYNVCTWNLTQRKVTGKVPDGLLINGQPLCFYHFSGFDSGAQKMMLDLYGKDSPVLYELRDWYINECSVMGQDQYGTTPCMYDCFSDGTKISKSHRYIYRKDPALATKFPDPFKVSVTDSFLNWYKNTYKDSNIILDNIEYHELLNLYMAVLNDVTLIRNSKSYKILKALGIMHV
ncbi:hypothetical protein KI809_18430 [Geobacter pelophilus]|uniref:Glycosyl transferase n=1 Tax=Geoanaerobacter pelophilus TaxID=60036 RepID=A0AAW4LEF6_9BACT|nr:glycosyltransferase [Geoanaerobacter pelophilus]MBT0666292.1 hypothetical protein [Geoanaerobacter pelophilus]